MADARLEPFMTPALATALTVAMLVVVVPISFVVSLGCIWECVPSDVHRSLAIATFPGAPLVVVAGGAVAAARRRGWPLVLGGCLACVLVVGVTVPVAG